MKQMAYMDQPASEGIYPRKSHRAIKRLAVFKKPQQFQREQAAS
jgi:hypothetical protein